MYAQTMQRMHNSAWGTADIVMHHEGGRLPYWVTARDGSMTLARHKFATAEEARDMLHEMTLTFFRERELKMLDKYWPAPVCRDANGAEIRF